MSCPSSVTPQEKPTVAINPIFVNGETIAESEIAQEVQNHPADSVEEALYQASNALVIQRLLKQKAQELGISSENGDAAADEEQAISALLEREAGSPEATDDECLRYFEANPERFCTSPLVELSHILLAAAPEDLKARLELKEQARELVAKLQAQPSLLPELAKKYSACPSKETGGSLGQLSKGQTVPEFEKVVFSLEEGVAEHPVESRYGFHIVQVHHRVEGQPLAFDMVSDRVRQYLNEKSQRKAISQYLHVLLSEADIDGFTPLISGSPLLQ